jgi:protein-S-isoprenylcysteine O-methyltransferase Ste14
VDALSKVGFGMMVAGLAMLLTQRLVLSPSVPVIVLQLAAVALMVWARLTFGRRSFHATASPTRGGIVRTGPYRWLRHPIYTAATLFGWACWLGHPSWFSASMAGLMTAGAVLRMFVEESLLVARYPEYADYARTTRRMVPFLF